MNDILFTCPTCRESYATYDEAAACRDQVPIGHHYKVGDLVITGTDYTWWEEEYQHWIALHIKGDKKHSSHFRHRDTKLFWFVITSIDLDKHHLKISVASLALGRHEGKPKCAGWNSVFLHYPMFSEGDYSIPEWGKGHWSEEYYDELFSFGVVPPSDRMRQEATELVGIRYHGLL